MRSHRGFFGKLPARGDFVTAGLPRDFVSYWDAWISSTLPQVLAAVGDGWMAAPARRFQLAPGVMGPYAITGVILPSVDKVARRFPLTLAWTDKVVDPDAAERLGRAAINEAMPPELVAQVLATLPAADGRQTALPSLSGAVTFATMMMGTCHDV